jgi:6-phosphogluconolactonase/glucosamine-6-phosphate isomerase/deaminase
MLVGVGINGHIGLNEPGADFNLYARYGDLAPVTVKVAQKYFKAETQLSQGITLGLKYLQEAKIPMLIASGAKKAAIIAQALNEPVTKQVPASIFQNLPQACVLLDYDAASQIDS